MNIIQISNNANWQNMRYTFLIKKGMKYFGINKWSETEEAVERYVVQYNLNPVRD